MLEVSIDTQVKQIEAVFYSLKAAGYKIKSINSLARDEFIREAVFNAEILFNDSIMLTGIMLHVEDLQEVTKRITESEVISNIKISLY